MAEMKEVFGIKKIDNRGEEKSFWTRIGVGFVNRDGSINVKLDYAPIDPNITLHIKDPREKKENTGDDSDNF